ncbi:MAG: glycoside hydrolase family 31 protein [Bacteroidota bacterium]
MDQNILENQTEFYPGSVTHWKQEGSRFQLFCDNGVILMLEILADRIIRFRYATQGYFDKDFSYAIDPVFEPEETPAVRVRDREQYLSVKTRVMECRVRKKGLHVSMLDARGKVMLEDDKGFHWEESPFGGNIVKMSKKARSDEAYFGLGDKTCHLNLRGERLQNWANDCFGYGSHTDPLYRSIPFYYGLHSGRAYGIFFDNSFRTHFDFGKERPEATSFWAQGGEMNYYFFFGPQLMEVAEQYAQLTGRPELPPRWAMGFHQCKWSYYPESQVKEIAAEFRSREIPCDAIYLDIDYMDGYRCFTWNNEHFPNPPRLLRELKEDGFHTVVIIDPGIKIDMDYPIFTEGLEKGYFCRRPDGPYVQGKVWPGECYFPDFTNPEVRTWWAGLFRDLIRKVGVSGVWNDMNEPAVFEVANKSVPDDVRHDYDGHPTSHRKAHNVYGMQMARATNDGVKHFAYPNRPFMITRASYAGGQRFSAAWTGDNNANWEHLKLASIQSQRMSISGFSFIGSDIGGFNYVPSGELFVRWLQCGIFHPLCRVHSIGYHDVGDAAVDEEAVAESMATREEVDQEPWSFGEEYTAVAKSTIELRYKLMPLLYTAFWQYVTYGTPVLRPLSFLDQSDPETLHRMEEFCVGDHLLVCPISDEGARGRYLYLPKGIWYDFRTDEPIPGEQEIWVEADLHEIPMFARAGGMIPQAPVMQYTNEKRIEVLDLHVYYKNGEENSLIYWDQGDGYDHEQGEYLLHKLTLQGENKALTLVQQVEGGYDADYDRIRLIIHGMPFKAKRCLVDGEPTQLDFHPTTTEVEVGFDFEILVLE